MINWCSMAIAVIKILLDANRNGRYECEGSSELGAAAAFVRACGDTGGGSLISHLTLNKSILAHTVVFNAGVREAPLKIA